MSADKRAVAGARGGSVIRAVIGVACAAFLFAGCSSRDDDLQHFIEATKKEPGGKVDALPEVKPYENFLYADSAQRSPFTPSSPGGSSSNLRPDSKRNREFLEQFSLDTLKMVGTLKVGGQLYGLVRTKDGLVHRVGDGNHIGQADGKITDITASKISLVEIVPDGLGGYMERPAALALSE
ncbi:MAG: pilus assembly protein PilP [Steroidobacteraceae bacterium]